MLTSRVRLIRRSFFRGLGSLLAISPPTTIVAYPHKDEAEALSSDWASIGQDMQRTVDAKFATLDTTLKHGINKGLSEYKKNQFNYSNAKFDAYMKIRETDRNGTFG